MISPGNCPESQVCRAGDTFELEEKSSPQVGPTEGFPHRDAEAVLAIVRTELRMDAYAVLLQAC